jgi:hypothetical protein
MERIPVKLLQYFGGVNAGEIAGYVPEVATRLIEQGFAEAYAPEAETAAPDTPADNGGKDKLPAQGKGA